MDGGGLLGDLVERSAEAVLRVVVEWIVAGTSWLLGQLMGFVTTSTRPDLGQAWFAVAYTDMARVARAGVADAAAGGDPGARSAQPLRTGAHSAPSRRVSSSRRCAWYR